MSKRNYTHVQELLPEIQAMLDCGCTQREVAEHFGFKSKRVIHNLLTSQRNREKKLAAGIVIQPKGRPRKDRTPRNIVKEQAYEIERLKMENKLLRDFLQSIGRK